MRSTWGSFSKCRCPGPLRRAWINFLKASPASINVSLAAQMLGSSQVCECLAFFSLPKTGWAMLLERHSRAGPLVDLCHSCDYTERSPGWRVLNGNTLSALCLPHAWHLPVHSSTELPGHGPLPFALCSWTHLSSHPLSASQPWSVAGKDESPHVLPCPLEPVAKSHGLLPTPSLFALNLFKCFGLWFSSLAHPVTLNLFDPWKNQ